jgi:hypothetical protein
MPVEQSVSIVQGEPAGCEPSSLNVSCPLQATTPTAPITKIRRELKHIRRISPKQT